MRPRGGHVGARQSLHDLVEERLRLLAPNERAVVQCAALLGYRIEAALLAACARVPIDQAVRALERAVQFDLVIVEGEKERRYRFRHALTQCAVRDAVAAECKRSFHASIATELERLADADDRSEQLAYHWFLAGNEAKGEACEERAAERARRFGVGGDVAVARPHRRGSA